MGHTLELHGTVALDLPGCGFRSQLPPCAWSVSMVSLSHVGLLQMLQCAPVAHRPAIWYIGIWKIAIVGECVPCDRRALPSGWYRPPGLAGISSGAQLKDTGIIFGFISLIDKTTASHLIILGEEKHLAPTNGDWNVRPGSLWGETSFWQVQRTSDLHHTEPECQTSEASRAVGFPALMKARWIWGPSEGASDTLTSHVSGSCFQQAVELGKRSWCQPVGVGEEGTSQQWLQQDVLGQDSGLGGWIKTARGTGRGFRETWARLSKATLIEHRRAVFKV